MNYYRVKAEYDQKPRIKNHKLKIKRVQDGVFIANELYTAGELEKFYIPIEKECEMFEHVVIPKNKVYWCFGCRFAIEEEKDKESQKKRMSETEKIMKHYDEGCKQWSELLSKN